MTVMHGMCMSMCACSVLNADDAESFRLSPAVTAALACGGVRWTKGYGCTDLKRWAHESGAFFAFEEAQGF
jgi:hypothetical protein